MTNKDIIAELHRIAAEHGGELRPADVVEAARLKTSPLHTQFQWDDTVAAHQWRLQQARQLIRVTVEYVGPAEKPVLARVFVSLTPDRKNEGGGYRATRAVMSNAAYRKQLLADALEEMQRFEAKYAELKELAEVIAAMKKVGKHKSAAA